jgi:hypothetical protein
MQHKGTIRGIGFLRHSVRGGIIINKNRRKIALPSISDYDSRTRNYAIPSIVAPQQSYSPLHVTIISKINKEYDSIFNLRYRIEKIGSMEGKIFN